MPHKFSDAYVYDFLTTKSWYVHSRPTVPRRSHYQYVICHCVRFGRSFPCFFYSSYFGWVIILNFLHVCEALVRNSFCATLHIDHMHNICLIMFRTRYKDKSSKSVLFSDITTLHITLHAQFNFFNIFILSCLRSCLRGGVQYLAPTRFSRKCFWPPDVATLC